MIEFVPMRAAGFLGVKRRAQGEGVTRPSEVGAGLNLACGVPLGSARRG